MSIDVMSRVWRDSPQKANKLLVLLAIADIADDNGWAYPAQNTLAKKCRVGRRGIQKLLDELERIGELVIYNRFDSSTPEQHFSNVYHLAKYGVANAAIPHELRGVIRKRSEQPDTTGVVNTETLGGSEQPDTTLVNSRALPSEQPDTRVVNSGSHYSLQEPSVTPSLEPKERNADLRDSTPMPYHIQNGLGRQKPNDSSPIIRAIESSPVYQAYVRGWDGITPAISKNTAQLTHDAVRILEGDVENGETTFAEIEAVTRWKRSDPRTRDYPVGFVKVDTKSYRAWKRAQEKAPSLNGNGNYGRAALVNNGVAKPETVSGGFAALKRQAEQAKQEGK